MMVLPVTDALVIHQSISLLRGEVGAQRRVRGSGPSIDLPLTPTLSPWERGRTEFDAKFRFCRIMF